MEDPVRQAEARLQRYWNVDGLHEIGVALIFALTALWVWASDLSELPHAWKGAFSATFPLLLCGGIYGERYVVNAIRRRLTYPRAGFAELRKPPRKRQVWAALAGAVVAAAIGAVAILRIAVDRFLVPLMGAAAGVLLWQIGARSGLPRFRAVSVLLALLGLAIAGAGWEFHIAIVAFFASAAAALLVSGGVTLWRFLHA